jgi:glycosyltransferase involved in cell wall biosynthesis
MIISDGRLSTRLIDFLFTRRLIKKSRVNLVLSETELSAIQALGIKTPCKVLPNGIAVSFNQKEGNRPSNRIAFCSRLEKRKGIGKFIELADSFRNAGIKFEIFGPDGGELEFVQSEVRSRNLSSILEYKGSLKADEVQRVLSEIDLLVLPSKDEPFPMVILEALAVGTPVLIMPSCGFASHLEKFEFSFVAQTEDLAGLVDCVNQQKTRKFKNKSHSEIIEFCNKEFGIAAVTDKLVSEYEKVIKND